jgi:hypothetical protein
MQHFYFLLGLGTILVMLFLFSLVRRLKARNRVPYRVDATLFSPQQRAFAAVLERAVGRDYRVYGRVRAADIIEVDRRLDRRSRERAEERLDRHTFDFLICTRETSGIACAVNLSPRSRLGWRPQKDGLDRICASSKLPFVRFRESDLYSVVEIEEQVFAAMHTLRLHSRAEEPSKDDTRAALRELSKVMSDQDDEPRRRSRQAPIGRSQPQPASPIRLKPRTRTEPRLAVDEDLDMGPADRMQDPQISDVQIPEAQIPDVKLPDVQIRVEYDEDRPRRMRR